MRCIALSHSYRYAEDRPMPSTTMPEPPIAEREPHTVRIHSTELHDDYAWLRDKESQRTLAYLKAENAYTAAMMAETERLQKDLYDEILSHIKEDDVSVPYRDGEWEYLVRTEKGLQYPRYCRRPSGAAGNLNSTEVVPDEMVILDVNQMAEGQAFMAIGDSAVSPDGRLLAYTTDNTGFRQYTLHIKDLATGEVLADTAERVGSLAWASNSATLFYSTEDDQTKRQDRLFRHKVGDTASVDVEVFHEPDERFNLGVGRTRDRRYLILGIGSHTTSESWFMEAAASEREFRLFAQRVDDEEYYIDHRDGFFYIRSNRDAEQFRLLRTRVDATARENWQELLPEHKDAPLEDFDLFQHFFVAAYRERGLPVLRVFSLDEGERLADPRDIRFPDPAYTAFSDINRDFNATTFRYAYQSLVRPASVFSYDIATGQSTLLKQQEVPGGFDASNYESERLWFRRTMGLRSRCRLFIADSRSARMGADPLYVYGYGSYGYPLPLGFIRFAARAAGSRCGGRVSRISAAVANWAILGTMRAR